MYIYIYIYLFIYLFICTRPRASYRPPLRPQAPAGQSDFRTIPFSVAKCLSGGGVANKRHSHTRRDTEKDTQTNMLWEQ